MWRRGRCHSGGFLLRIMPPSWRPVPACAPRPCCRRAVLRCCYDCCRRAIIRCRYECCRPNCSTLRRRKLESDAVRYCGGDRCHSGGFLLRIMPPSWRPVPACAPRPCCRWAVLLCDEENWRRTRRRCDYDCCRRNCSTLPARWRCIDSRFQAQTCESLQPRGHSWEKSCIDSRFQAQTCESMQPWGRSLANPCIDSRFQAQTCESM